MKISPNLYGRMDGSKFWCFPWFPENSLLCVILCYTVYIKVRKLFKGGNYLRKYGIIWHVRGFRSDKQMGSLIFPNLGARNQKLWLHPSLITLFKHWIIGLQKLNLCAWLYVAAPMRPPLKVKGDSSVRTTCPNCGSEINTIVTKDTSMVQWLFCLGICGFGFLCPCTCLGCCFIPFCLDWEDVTHTCPACNYQVSKQRKWAAESIFWGIESLNT